MNAELLLKEFHRASEAPGGVDRLREFILYLAIRGRLVEQNPKDEQPAGLLSRIEKERVRRAMSGEPVRGRPYEDPSERPFSTPEGWHWAKLGFLTNIVMGQSPPGSSYNQAGHGTPLINGPVEFSEGPFGFTLLNQYTTEPTKMCRKGDLLLCVRGSTTGRTNVASVDACIGRGVAALQPLFADGFVRLFVWSRRKQIIAMGRGIAFPSVSLEQIENLVTPLPPLAEQDRIIAKVNELMDLCDQLIQRQQERDIMHNALASASLVRFAEKPTTFNLQFLFHPKYNVPPSKLRKAILSLAMQGRLVSQDPKDLQNPTPALPYRSKQVDTKDFPHAIPHNWSWVKLEEIAHFVNGDRSKNYPSKAYRTESGVPFINAGHLINGNVALTNMDYISEQHFERLRGGKVEHGDILYCLRGSLGKTAIVESISRGAIASSLLILRPAACVVAKFLYFYLISPLGDLMISRYDNGTAQPNLSASNVKNYLLPLPPASEQRRIVARIDNLMALLGEVEGQLAKAYIIGTNFVKALLAES